MYRGHTNAVHCLALAKDIGVCVGGGGGRGSKQLIFTFIRSTQCMLTLHTDLMSLMHQS